jgi:hypothetical protein
MTYDLRLHQLVVRLQDRDGTAPGLGLRRARDRPPRVRVTLGTRRLTPVPKPQKREQTFERAKHRSSSETDDPVDFRVSGDHKSKRNVRFPGC